LSLPAISTPHLLCLFPSVSLYFSLCLSTSVSFPLSWAFHLYSLSLPLYLFPNVSSVSLSPHMFLPLSFIWRYLWSFVSPLCFLHSVFPPNSLPVSFLLSSASFHWMDLRYASWLFYLLLLLPSFTSRLSTLSLKWQWEQQVTQAGLHSCRLYVYVISVTYILYAL
jgi:hypothetical protein